MPLSIEKRVEENVAILELAGTLTLGPSLFELRNWAREVAASAKLSGLVLDVGRITSVDSSGLGELTIVYTAVSRHDCPMRLVGCSSSLKKMLQMTHLDAVLICVDDFATAKQQLRRPV